ncbi:type III pantothenate kinase [Erysipelothrix sp. HDW6C]|uniref:type III pantothenate kinase n=1 Tax=Erysipelothrix sp. HDW6C TaxID=2714930 RepID=UPI0014099A02|nr:type III pantothenate kinase [Erysipelothrix sp. HDW6C]QIK70744.1 type III pantothenate kinase [Erysipelothrix sp. HDW6C]
MIITVDIGNSNTVIVAYEGDAKIIHQRILTEKENPFEYYKQSFVSLNVKPEAVVVSCVVPVIQRAFCDAIQAVFGFEPCLVNADTINGFDILLDNPRDIGADFIATSMGAIGKYPLPAIVADVGSATKLTYTDDHAAFRGGVIIPGLGTSMKAFRDYIPHLPEVELTIPKNVIGTGTIDAIQSGALYGLIAQIEGLAQRMEEEAGQPCVKILTGGYASLIRDNMTGFVYDPDLLNDGLYEIYRKGMVS